MGRATGIRPMSVEVDLKGSFGDFTLDVSFDAPSGCISLFGRSGAGKTTIAQSIAGLRKVKQGRIVVDGDVLLDTTGGANTAPHQRNIGVVFQEARLFPHYDVTANLNFASRFLGGRTPQLSFDETVDLLDLQPLLKRRPRDLSGGEKQRVAIGRALLSAPRLLVLDEPLTGLDGARREQILQALERLRDRAALPMIHISHSVSEVALLADTLVLLANGSVEHSGAARDIFANPDLAGMLGAEEAGAVLNGTVSRNDNAVTAIDVGGHELQLGKMDAPHGTKVRLRIKASDVILATAKPTGLSAQNILSTVVDQVIERPDGEVMVSLRLGDERLLARVTKRAAVALELKPDTVAYAIIKFTSLPRAYVVERD
ncbi:molybdate ABC transporter, ATP-binding protein [Ahrensia sp. R2A130]|nr:molybdate ABC transporter, ATP-binding protein [Ahrensia sp. R2A130]